MYLYYLMSSAIQQWLKFGLFTQNKMEDKQGLFIKWPS